VPRETDPTSVVTRSNEVSRVEPTSAMVTRSSAREGRRTNIVPEIEFRPETETQPEPEIQVSMSTTCEEGLGATRPSISDTASQYVTADKPETTDAFTTSQETNPNLSTASQTSPSHTCILHCCKYTPSAAIIKTLSSLLVIRSSRPRDNHHSSTLCSRFNPRTHHNNMIKFKVDCVSC